MEVGDTVLYTPTLDHGLDFGPSGFLFRFVHLDNGRNSAEKFSQGDTASPPSSRDERGILLNSKGQRIAPVAPLMPWPATITAVHDDDTTDLMVKHPNGTEFGACNIREDSEGALGTFRVEEQRPEQEED